MNGWAIHTKWQEDLLEGTGLVLYNKYEGMPELDLTHIDEETGIHYSPDVILQFGPYVIPVEIKGINTEDFKGNPDLYLEDGTLYREARPGIIGATLQDASARNKSIRSAIPQLNLYLHLLGLTTPPNDRGIILVEDKNTQQYELFVHEYDPEISIPARKNAESVQVMLEHFDFTDGALPDRICGSIYDARAKRCPFRDTCFKR